MRAAASLLPELESALADGSEDKRTAALERLTDLFIAGSSQFTEAHVGVFDDVLSHLVTEIETRARVELSQKMAPIDNAPRNLVRQLASDDDIAVAGPVLSESTRLADNDLAEIARSKSQAHLFAISGRSEIGESITELLVQRGDRDVVRNVADNPGARLSQTGMTELVRRAGDDGVLAEKVGQRGDIPPHLFRQLLTRATAVVQQRLLAAAHPATRAQISDVLASIGEDIAVKADSPRDFSAAALTVDALKAEGKLNEAALCGFAQAKRYEESLACLAALTEVPLRVVDKLVSGDRPDPLLILCKASGFAWQTAKALIVARPGVHGKSNQALDEAGINFDRLSADTALRVVRFWQLGHGGAAA